MNTAFLLFVCLFACLTNVFSLRCRPACKIVLIYLKNNNTKMVGNIKEHSKSIELVLSEPRFPMK